MDIQTFYHEKWNIDCDSRRKRYMGDIVRLTGVDNPSPTVKGWYFH